MEPRALSIDFSQAASLNTFCGVFQPHLLNWWECRLVQPLWKSACRFLKKQIKLEVTYDSTILLLGIHQQKPKTLIQKGAWTPTFIAALFQ